MRKDDMVLAVLTAEGILVVAEVMLVVVADIVMVDIAGGQ
jgi:hypothetical protein